MLIPPSDFRGASEGSGRNPDFVRLKTPLILVLEALLFVGLEVAAFLLPHFLSSKVSPESAPSESLPYYIVLYVQALFWGIVFLLDRCMWLEHRKV